MIKKRTMTDYGIEAETWKLGYISLDRVAKYGSITMNLYVSEEAKTYIKSVVEPIKEEVFDKYFETETNDFYNQCEKFMLEQCEFFKDAELL